MDFRKLNPNQIDEYTELLFAKFQSKEDIQNWVSYFLDIDLPLETVDGMSTSSPLSAIWEIYENFLHNKGGEESPSGYVLMSCREGYKTISVALIEVILLLHFELEIAHAAATETQSTVGLGYIDGFLSKIQPLMEHRGWEKISENKRTLSFKAPSGKNPFIQILICTSKGMNSRHANVLFLDELDLADPAALKEARNIVSFSRGVYGLNIFLSTRKYAFGNMAEIIGKIDELNYKLLSWNIIDVTERCPSSRYKPTETRVTRYVDRNLPLRQIDQGQFEFLSAAEQKKFDKLDNVYGGCVKCPLLPVCRMKLSEKDESCTGGFYKPIITVIQKFRENDPDTAEAQLMCFSENAEILMGNGISKPISEIQVDEEVITHLGNVKKVTQVFKRKFEGEAYKVKNHNWKHFSETIVTEEHPYLIDGAEFKSISQVATHDFDKYGGLKKKGDYFSFPSSYISNNKKEIYFSELVNKEVKSKNGLIKIHDSTGRYIPEKYKLDHNFGWIIGYYLAEGHISERKYDKNIRFTNITFSSNINENEYHDKVRDFAKKCNLTASEFACKGSKGYTIDIYNNTISELFNAICGRYSDKKKINPLLMNSNLNFLKGILEGFDAGDGTKRKQPYKELTTCSYNLATQLFVIAGRLGLCPRITKKPFKEGRKQAYLIHYIDKDYDSKQKRTKFKSAPGYNLYRVDKLEKQAYSGYVYNVEVEDDHSYIANGVAVHNCWKPGSSGLVYPRLVTTVNLESRNVLTIDEAYKILIGKESAGITEDMLLAEIQKQSIEINAGVDWGFTHEASIGIVAFPADEVWALDTFSAPGMEFSDIFEVAIKYRDRYEPRFWWVDQARPEYMVTFNKNGMKSPKFTKDVIGGISALRAKIVDGTGKRRFKIILTESNKKLINALNKHKFVLDAMGESTDKPADEQGIADIADMMRYIAQNKFPVKGAGRIHHSVSEPKSVAEQQAETVNGSFLKAVENATGVQVAQKALSTKKKGGFFFSW
jgi:intein/homing endonuclease